MDLNYDSAGHFSLSQVYQVTDVNKQTLTLRFSGQNNGTGLATNRFAAKHFLTPSKKATPTAPDQKAKNKLAARQDAAAGQGNFAKYGGTQTSKNTVIDLGLINFSKVVELFASTASAANLPIGNQNGHITVDLGVACVKTFTAAGQIGPTVTKVKVGVRHYANNAWDINHLSGTE